MIRCLIVKTALTILQKSIMLDGSSGLIIANKSEGHAGLRNARIGFRQQEMTHIMENIIYNELAIRKYVVDVGVVIGREINQNGNCVRVPREIDFVASSGGKRIYIQSAFALDTEEKAQTEMRPFLLTGDSFPKVIVRKDIGRRWYDENGILNINVIDFLLDKKGIN